MVFFFDRIDLNNWIIEKKKDWLFVLEIFLSVFEVILDNY